MKTEYVEIEQTWAMPNKKTFQIKPIAKLIKEEAKEPIIDLFPYPYKQDALIYARTLPDNHASTI